MKKIFKYILCVLGSALLLAACEKSPEVLDEIDYTRVLTPTKFSAEIVPSTGTDVILTWQKIKNAESYELEIYEQTDDSNEVSTANTGTLVDMYAVQPDEIPYTVYGLTVDKSFYARVRGVNPDLQASNWAYLEKTFSTSAVRSSLNPVVTTRTQNSITLSWDKADDKADLTSILVEPVVLKEGDAPETKVALAADDITAASKTVDGLQAGREYRFTLLFGKAGKRGSVTANTRPNIDGTPTVISSAAALLAALDNQAGTIKLMLDYADDAYDITPLYPDPTKKYANVVGDVYLYGNATEAGKKPSVKGLVFSLASGATKLHAEDVVFDGDGTDAVVVMNSAAMENIEFVNCEMSGFTKGIYSAASGATGKVANYLVDGCYVHDINADGSVGGDFIDVRSGVNGDFTVRNSTFYACARTFFRMSDNATVGNVLAENCTFNYVTATPSSSNNSGIFGVRVKAAAKSVKAIKNVFMNEYNDKEGETSDKGWVRLCRNSSDSYRVECTGNVYFNMGVAWWTSAAIASSTDALGDKAFDEIAKTDATLLTDDPCVNSAAGKLYLAGTAGEQIKSLKAGDPRWWDAVMPVVVRETELKVQEEAYTWDFTQKTIYDTEELTANTIIGNARIYATSTVPAKVVMSKGIDFSTGASVSPAGVPTYSAVEVLTKGYGSVKVTATSDDGLGSMQVLAGGDRYPVLADGKEHTVVLGDLAGENSIYVIADKPVTLKKVAWTKDLTQDVTVQKLATPSVTVTPNKLDEGTEEAVVIFWPAVANAADYILTFNGAEQTLTEPTFTIAAADVAALAEGEYPVTVVARPVPTSSKYEKSEEGKSKLTINKVVSGETEITLTWDFTAEYKADFDVKDTKTYKYEAGDVTAVDSATETEVLYFSPNNKSIKYAGKQSTANSVTYKPITYGGGAAYAFFRTDKAGTLKITATQGKVASDNSNCKLGIKVGGTAFGTDVDLGPYDTSKELLDAKVFEWEITNTTGDVQEIQIVKPSGATSPWIYKIEFTYKTGTVAPQPFGWHFTAEYKADFDVKDTKTYKYEAGDVTAVDSATETEVLYFSPNNKSIKYAGKQSTANSVTYKPITYGGGAAYAFFRTDKAGTLKITATQGKVASDNSNCKLGIKVGGTAFGTDVDLGPYDTSKELLDAKVFEWEITNTTGDVQEIQIVKPSGATSPWIYDITFEPK